MEIPKVSGHNNYPAASSGPTRDLIEGADLTEALGLSLPVFNRKITLNQGRPFGHVAKPAQSDHRTHKVVKDSLQSKAHTTQMRAIKGDAYHTHPSKPKRH